MNKKIITIIISVVCVFAVMTVTVGYMIKQGVIDLDNITMEKNENIADENTADEKNAILGPFFLKLGADTDAMATEDILVHVKFNSMEITKQRGDFDFGSSWYEIKDEKGNITNDYSYIVCNVTMENKSDIEYEGALNTFMLSFGVDNGYSEARVYNSKFDSTDFREYFHFKFAPKESYDFNIAYVVGDEEIKQYKADMMLLVTFVNYDGNVSETNYPIIENK